MFRDAMNNISTERKDYQIQSQGDDLILPIGYVVSPERSYMDLVLDS